MHKLKVYSDDCGEVVEVKLSIADSIINNVKTIDNHTASFSSSSCVMLGLPCEMTAQEFKTFLEPYLQEISSFNTIHAVTGTDRFEVELKSQCTIIHFNNEDSCKSFALLYNNLHFPSHRSAPPCLVIPLMQVIQQQTTDSNKKTSDNNDTTNKTAGESDIAADKGSDTQTSLLSSSTATSVNGNNNNNTIPQNERQLPLCSVCIRRIKSLSSRIDGVNDVPVSMKFTGNGLRCLTCRVYGGVNVSDEVYRLNQLQLLQTQAAVSSLSLNNNAAVTAGDTSNSNGSATLVNETPSIEVSSVITNQNQLNTSITSNTTTPAAANSNTSNNSHATSVSPSYENDLNKNLSKLRSCITCGLMENIWVCLICAHTGCGRYTCQHAKQHYEQSHHSFSLELASGRIWDYDNDTFAHVDCGSGSSSSGSNRTNRVMGATTTAGSYSMISSSHVDTTIASSGSSKVESDELFQQQNNNNNTHSNNNNRRTYSFAEVSKLTTSHTANGGSSSPSSSGSSFTHRSINEMAKNNMLNQTKWSGHTRNQLGSSSMYTTSASCNHYLNGYNNNNTSNNISNNSITTGLSPDICHKLDALVERYENLLEQQLKEQQVFYEKKLRQETFQAFCQSLSTSSNNNISTNNIQSGSQNSQNTIKLSTTCTTTVSLPSSSSTLVTKGLDVSSNNNNDSNNNDNNDIINDRFIITEDAFNTIIKYKSDISAIEYTTHLLHSQQKEIDSNIKRLTKENNVLMRMQQKHQEKINEVEKNVVQTQKTFENEISELEQQVRDLSFYARTRAQLQSSSVSSAVKAEFATSHVLAVAPAPVVSGTGSGAGHGKSSHGSNSSSGNKNKSSPSYNTSSTNNSSSSSSSNTTSSPSHFTTQTGSGTSSGTKKKK